MPVVNVLQIVGLVVLGVVAFGFVVGTFGPVLGGFIVLPALAILGPLAECARLRRQNERMYGLLGRTVHPLISGPGRRSWWAYRKENLLLQGELAGLSIEVPSASPTEAHDETRSERVYRRINGCDFALHIAGASVLAVGVLLLVLLD